MIRTEVRTARKPHYCSTGTSHCTIRIKPGDRYLLHVASPNHDGLGNQGWWPIAECAGCAETYGRPIAANPKHPMTSPEDTP